MTTGRRADGLPTVIAHRGASGLRPEHTLGGYRLALEQGADLIEQDLLLTRDGVLVALHDITLNRTTDVADHAVFAPRARRDKKGKPMWMVHDFTLAELRTLRVHQAIKGRPTAHDGKETIPTFAEAVALVRAHNATTGSHAGLCPELKDVTALRKAGLDIESIFLAAVRELKLDQPDAPPVVVQCFELDALERLRPNTKLPLQFLLDSRPPEKNLARIRAAADIIAVEARHVTAPGGAAWIKSIHDRGLGVYAWTFRDDKPGRGFNNSETEIRAAIASGVDGFFTDFPATGVAARGSKQPAVR